MRGTDAEAQPADEIGRVAFVHNFCAHYHVRTFELLAGRCSVCYMFHSDGSDWFWLREHGIRSGEFPHRYLPGLSIGRFRFSWALVRELWSNDCTTFVKSINGRIELLVTYLIARTKRKPFVLWTGVWTRLQTPFHRVFRPVVRWIYRHSDAIVVYGDHVKRYLTQAEGVNPQRIFVAHHALDNRSYARPVVTDECHQLAEDLGLSLSQRVVLFVGRLEIEKGVDILLEAFARARLNDALLVIAGTGSRRGELEHLASRLGIEDRVRFSGYIPVDRVVVLYSIAWVVVMPSVTTRRSKETWGLVANEAFNQGVPVIATDAVGAAAAGFIADGVNGLVTRERDTDELREAIVRLVGDEDLRARLSSGARASVAQQTQERMVDGFMKALAHVNRERLGAQSKATD